MKDRIVFITGASSGIGLGCARKFASQGASLILNARNVTVLEDIKKSWKQNMQLVFCYYLLMFVTEMKLLRH